MNIFKKHFLNNSELSKKDYTRDRAIFIIDASVEEFVGNILGGSYLASLLAFFCINEAKSNFILSLSTAAGLAQIFAPRIFQNFTHKKPLIYICRFFSRMPMALVFLFSLFLKGMPNIAFITSAVYFISLCLAYLLNPPYNTLLMNTISFGGGVGRYCGKKDAITNGVLIIAFFMCALVTKNFNGNTKYMVYIIFGAVSLFLWIIQMGSLFFLKEMPMPEPEEKAKIFSGIIDCIRSKKFRPFFIYNIINSTAAYMLASLVSIFCVQRLHMSLEFLSFVTMADLILRSVLCLLAGRLADKTGMRKLCIYGTVFVSTNYFIHIFMNSGNAMYLKCAASFFSALGYAFQVLASYNYMFECLPKNKGTAFMASSNTISIAVGYAASLFSTFVISAANGFSLKIFGFVFSEMHLLILFASIIMFSGALFLSRQKDKENLS